VLTANGTANSADSEANLTFDAGPPSVFTISGSTVNIHNPIAQLSGATGGGGYGDIVTFGSGTTVAGKVYYLTNLLGWTQTDASSYSTANGMLGVALGTTPSQGLVVRGYVKNALYTGDTGVILYLSTTPGEVTSTQPSGSSDIVRVIGYQISADNDIIYFNPSQDWIQLVI
jgi:hypothetical protein